ncbi:hypothetical protein [Elioraea rosea]|uniref:hypothetical protein n=1 Tax=Elioraea rosea TaxID=2492390 RepID=UPI0011833A2F|nr:hypothetical protein [Elioraea rosea]
MGWFASWRIVEYRREIVPVCLVLGVLLLIQPLHVFAFRNQWGHDSEVLVRFVAQVAAEGTLWPSPWLTEAQAGLGSPVFSFYPPLLFALANAFHASGLVEAHATSLALARITILLAGVAGAVLVLRRQFGRRAAVAGFLVFALSPYIVFINVTLRYAAAESAASGLMFLALALAVAAARGSAFAAPWLAVVIALILLTHVPSFIMTAVLIGAFALASRPARMLPVAACALMLAVILGAFHALPASHLKEAISLGLFLAEGHSYRGTMLFWGRLAVTQFSYVWALLYATFFGLVASAAVLLAGRLRPVAAEPVPRGLAASLLAALALTTPLSLPLWEHLRVLGLLQFPWRFLGGASVAAAVLAAVLAGTRRRVGVLGLQGALLAAFVASFAMFAVADRWPHRKPAFAVGAAMDRAVAGNTLLSDPPEYIPRRAREAGWVVVVEQEGRHVPVGREIVPLESLPRLVAGDGTVEMTRDGAARLSIRASCASACTAELPQFWFPGWAVSAGGGAEIAPSAAGLVALSLPAGRSEVTIAMTPPPIALTARSLSLAGLVALVAWFGLVAAARRRARRLVPLPAAAE